jgi:alanyl-tRNA synthetase
MADKDELDDTDTEDGGGGTHQRPKTIDYATHKDLHRRHRKANERIAELEGRLGELEPRAATVDQLTQKLKDQQKQFETERSTWQTDLQLRDAGISDAHGRTVVRALYNELPEKDRPALGSWLEALKKEPTKAPKPLQPYLTAEGGEVEQAGEQRERAGQGGGDQKQRANPNRGVISGGSGGGSAKPTSAEIKAALEKARQGDTADYEAVQRRMGLKPLQIGAKK